MNGPFMNRRPLTAVAAAVTVAMGLSACASNTGSTDAATGGAYGIDWAKNAEQWGQLPADHVAGEMITEEEWYEILGPVPEEPIELALFKGGFGEEWGDIITELMEKEHPGIQLEFTWDPSIAEKIQPRLIAGDVPDVLFYGFADPAQAVTDELAMPVDILLDVEGYGDLGGQRLGDWFVPGSLESANANFPENTWAFPQTSFTFGVFYNGTLFDENGWPAPSELTWEEFVELQEEIAQELPVWAYAGGNAPGYFGYVTQPLIYKNIGADAWCDLNNVVEGAWNNPGIVEALELQQQIMTTPGFQLAGTEAMTHTESQQAFVEGKVAMIPNGSWLASEQKSTTPEGFDMRFSAVPAPANGLGFPQAIAASLGGTDMMVGNGDNPLWALEVMRMFYSPEMAEFWASEIGSPLPLQTGDTVPSTPYSESITSAIAAADGHFITDNFGGYEAIGKVWGDNFQDMLYGKISATEFTEMLERAAQETRDSGVEIIERTCS